MSQWFHNTHTHWPHDVNSLLSDHIYSCGLSGVQNKQRRLRGECLKLEKLRTSSVPTTKLRSSREQTADLPPQQHVRPVFKYSSCISEADRASRRIWVRPEALCSQNIGDSFLGEGRRSKVTHPGWGEVQVSPDDEACSSQCSALSDGVDQVFLQETHRCCGHITPANIQGTFGEEETILITG